MTTLLVLCSLVPQWAAAPASTAAPTAIESIKPSWNVGDRWQVETSAPSVASHSDRLRHTVVRWQFEVEATETVNRRDCYRVRIQCLTRAAQQPKVLFWAERKTLALVQVQAEIPTRGGRVLVSENYAFLGNQPTPVIGPFSALPIDLPCFQGDHTKNVGDYYYEAIPGPAGSKAVGDAGFLFRVSQAVAGNARLSAEALGSAKSAGNGRLTQVTLRNHATTVQQYWQPGLPWPVLSANGQTVSRLVPQP